MLTFSIGTDFDKTNNTIYTCNYLNYPYCLSLIVFAKLACIIYNLNAVNHQSTFQTATHQLNDKVKCLSWFQKDLQLLRMKLYIIFMYWRKKYFWWFFLEISSGLLQNDHNYGSPRYKRPIGYRLSWLSFSIFLSWDIMYT